MKIDKNIPVPNDKPKYPFSEMEIGDSIWMENGASGAASAYMYRKKHPEFNFMKKSDKEGLGARLWRIEPKRK